MEFSVQLALLLIVVLAALDLWVGVANDAVNFLNAAIGSRVATRRAILWVAAAGVLFGALTSSGLMEVARRGVFDPTRFSSPETGAVLLGSILAIYLAVMVADVLLLDLFNTFGLPTSTTVSIISELVGASLAVALWTLPGGLSGALDVIQSGPVVGIYTGIFTSVLVAFTTSAVLMFVVRLIYGHHLDRTFPVWGWMWTGASLSALTYFVVFKGLSNAAVLPERLDVFLHEQIAPLMAMAFVTGSAIALVLRRHHQRVLSALILLGTGALAIAFAGNDLVNFIGPAVAAAQAVFSAGAELSGAAQTPPWALLLAGAMMVGALVTSRKARRVTDTEIRLAGHSSTTQRFNGNGIAAGIVGLGRLAVATTASWIPTSVRSAALRRVAPPPRDPHDPPYDPLRASVNLTVAALLISTGTTLGLPLSTTYITFTAAMGAALGDLAWSRHDAEQRVAGILVVLGGWVVTGVLAALGAFAVASLIVLGGTGGVLLATGGVAFGIYRLHHVKGHEPEHG